MLVPRWWTQKVYGISVLLAPARAHRDTLTVGASRLTLDRPMCKLAPQDHSQGQRQNLRSQHQFTAGVQVSPPATMQSSTRSHKSSNSSLRHTDYSYADASVSAIPMADAGTQSESRSSSRLLQRAASIRNKFRRRGSVSASTDTTEPVRPSRSRSITDRFRFRRGSSAHDNRPLASVAPPTAAAAATAMTMAPTDLSAEVYISTGRVDGPKLHHKA